MQVIFPYNKTHEIYIGTQIGTLKKCTTNQRDDAKDSKKSLKEIRNLKDTCETDIGVAITSMCWSNEEKTEILLAQRNNTIRTYNTLDESSKLKLRITDKDPIVAVFKHEKVLATCTNGGKLNLWKNKKSLNEINVGRHVAAFQQSATEKNLFVTGGKENITKIWDINTSTCTFTAKNEPHDALQLEVPIWISDNCFMPESNSLIATTSRYGKARLYDQRAQRRPVVIVDVETPMVSLSPCHERSIMVGTTTGTMQLIDLRAKGKALNTYKDFSGSVTKIICDDQDPFIISVSLDRFLRIHHRDTKKMVYKVYIKTKPSCLLMKNVETQIEKSEDEERNSGSDSDDCLSDLPTIQ